MKINVTWRDYLLMRAASSNVACALPVSGGLAR
jgi:hypothetical protein